MIIVIAVAQVLSMYTVCVENGMYGGTKSFVADAIFMTVMTLSTSTIVWFNKLRPLSIEHR